MADVSAELDLERQKDVECAEMDILGRKTSIRESQRWEMVGVYRQC